MGHRPRKQFGQNFLVDLGVIERILHVFAPQPGQTVVEIGPGQGALTEPLLERLPELTIIEIDRDLAAAFRLHPKAEKLHLFEQDVLTMDWAKIPAPFRLIGNLPYNISSPLLLSLIPWAPQCQDALFMLQKEVADRITAQPGDRAYGRLTVMLQKAFTSHPILDVPPEAFSPPPKVQSAVIQMLPRPDVPAIQDDALFDEVVFLAFNQRRKTLSNALKTKITAEALESLGISPKLRAEAVSFESFRKLANYLA